MMDVFLVYVIIFGIVVGIHYKFEEIGVVILLQAEQYINMEELTLSEIADTQYELASKVRRSEFVLFGVLAILFMYFPLSTLALASLILALLTFLSVA